MGWSDPGSRTDPSPGLEEFHPIHPVSHPVLHSMSGEDEVEVESLSAKLSPLRTQEYDYWVLSLEFLESPKTRWKWRISRHETVARGSLGFGRCQTFWIRRFGPLIWGALPRPGWQALLRMSILVAPLHLVSRSRVLQVHFWGAVNGDFLARFYRLSWELPGLITDVQKHLRESSSRLNKSKRTCAMVCARAFLLHLWCGCSLYETSMYVPTQMLPSFESCERDQSRCLGQDVKFVR